MYDGSPSPYPKNMEVPPTITLKEIIHLFDPLEAIVFIPSLVDETEKSLERLRKLVRKVYNTLTLSIGDLNVPLNGYTQTLHATDVRSQRTTDITLDTFRKIGLESSHKYVSPSDILDLGNNDINISRPVADLLRRNTQVLILVRPRGDGFFMQRVTGELRLSPAEGSLIWYPQAEGFEDVVWNKS